MAMRAICAWCGKTVTEGDAGEGPVSHGICPQCARRFFASGWRYAVVPRERSFLLAEIGRAFRAVGSIRVILDRRQSDRRWRRLGVRDDRRGPRRDRREASHLIVGALPLVAGLYLLGGRPLTDPPGYFPMAPGRGASEAAVTPAQSPGETPSPRLWSRSYPARPATRSAQATDPRRVGPA